MDNINWKAIYKLVKNPKTPYNIRVYWEKRLKSKFGRRYEDYVKL